VEQRWGKGGARVAVKKLRAVETYKKQKIVANVIVSYNTEFI